MRIAFVGKGGSGKTTLSALFSLYICQRYPTLVIDADLNMHLASLLGVSNPQTSELHLSHPKAVEIIKEYLRGQNVRIRELIHFRKTTPPTAESNFISVRDGENPIVNKFGSWNGNLCHMVVGAYETEEIGTGCYHNNLAILENILSHLVDREEVFVSDMVAGVDAFANTLHAQFDMLVLVVEPTRRGVEVFKQYEKLSTEAGVWNQLFIVGNKIKSEIDRQFLETHIPKEKLIGYMPDSEYLRRKDQEGGSLDVAELESDGRALLEIIEKQLFSFRPNYDVRLRKLFELHRKYVSQASIRERFGDLSDQIDPDFSMQILVDTYGKSDSHA